MKEKIKKITDSLGPYKGIIQFVILLFFFHFSWKIAISGDMDSEYVYLFGKDITPGWMNKLCEYTALVAYKVIHLFPGGEKFIIDGTRLYFSDGLNVIRIIWGCTGFKQMYIFAGIMLFYRGPFLKKLWYIPMGCVILSIYNIIRISSISGLTRYHPERFDSLHDGIFRYIYYGLIFLLWVIWEEFIVQKELRKKEELKKKQV